MLLMSSWAGGSRILDSHSLELFGPTAICYMSLEGLSTRNDTQPAHANIDDTLSVFARPGSFLQLVCLSLAGVAVPVNALSHLSYLSLTLLNLSHTEMSLGGLCQLATSRNLVASLCHFHLADNPSVDDSCTPVLLLFSKLTTVNLRGTSISIQGVRSLVVKSVLHTPSLDSIAPPNDMVEWLVSACL